MNKIAAIAIRIGIVAIIAVVLVVTGSKLIQKKRDALAKAPVFGEKPVIVHVATAEKGTISSKLTYLARFVPVRTALIAPRISADILKVSCYEGDKIAAGETLVTLDSREIKEKIASARSVLSKMTADLAANEATVNSLEKSIAYWKREAGRDKTLASKNNIPISQAEGTAEKANEFEGRLIAARQKSRSLKFQIASQKKQIDQFKVQLTYCTLTCPFAGVVTKRMADPGSLATAGKAILEIEDPSEMMMSFTIPQEDLKYVRVGLIAEYYNGKELSQCTVTRIYPSLTDSKMAIVECAVPSSVKNFIRSGSYVSLSVVTASNDFDILVPRASLIESSDGAVSVFVVNGDRLKVAKVDILAEDEDLVAVSGIDKGATVVSNTFLGWAVLAGGVKVELVR